jgi:hypothetical protein
MTLSERDVLLLELQTASIERCREIAENLLLTASIDPEPYDQHYGDDRKCECGHAYYRHYDSYDEMSPIGCKYCKCDVFVETSFKSESK